jgi:hypothetical protein
MTYSRWSLACLAIRWAEGAQSLLPRSIRRMNTRAIFGMFCVLVGVLTSVIASPASQASPTNQQSSAITGSFDDWIHAVCPSGRSSAIQENRATYGKCLPATDPVRDEAVSYTISNSVQMVSLVLSNAQAKYFARAYEQSTARSRCSSRTTQPESNATVMCRSGL